MKLPAHLHKKIQQRQDQNTLRELTLSNKDWVDFSSNDYLGLAREIEEISLPDNETQWHGSTGSRLLSGHSKHHEMLENELATYFNSASATLYNSGYDANIGLLSSIGQRGDVFLYDELSHASIRDGIKLSHAKGLAFKHNSLEALKDKWHRIKEEANQVYVVVESIYSMDGDKAPLKELVEFCNQNQLALIVDEAHAVGVYHKGLVDQGNYSDKVFATVVTFGKALGCHGAAVLGNDDLKTYLVNFSKSFIYTTAMSVHTVLIIKSRLEKSLQPNRQELLRKNINSFINLIDAYKLSDYFISSDSAIQSCVVGDSQLAKQISNALNYNGFDVKPILAPTVGLGKERLRFCIHSFNSEDEMKRVLKLLSTFVVNFLPLNE